MKNLLSLICISLMILFGCKKDRKVKQIDDPCLIDSTFTVHHQYPGVGGPKVNPNNPNEIAFIKNKYFSNCCDLELIVFNIESKEQKAIHKGFFSDIDWSAKNWIIFLNLDDQKIYKIRPSGDSLTQLTNESSLYPEWNSTGDRFIYRYRGAYPSPSGIKICDDEGLVLQHFPEKDAKFDTWQHDSLLATAGTFWPNNDLLLINIFTPNEIADNVKYHSKAFIENGGRSEGCEWIDNDNLIVASKAGIFKVTFSDSLQNYNIVQIRETCTSLEGWYTIYRHPTVSRQTKKVIFHKSEYEFTGTKEVIITNRFVRMNYDGTNEEVIEIPGL